MGRAVGRVVDAIIIALCAGLCLFHLYTGTIGLYDLYVQRGIHLFLILTIGALAGVREERGVARKILSGVLLVATIVPFAHLFTNMGYFTTRLWGAPLSRADLVSGVILAVLVFVACYQAVGLAMPLVALGSVLYCFVGEYLPGILQHGGYSAKFMVELISWSDMGIFSTSLGVSATYLFLFILFGGMIDHMGTGGTLIDLAKALAGEQKGGPAKIAVVSSAMLGTISGSPVANVLTTGAFTIPMMKKLGFEPAYAGAVEAVASTGGMILPPVMGILAFMMVDYAGIPYSKIIKSAAIPAVLYYLACYLSVHLHAHKMNLKALDKSELPSARDVLRKGWLTLVPVIILAVPLMMGYTPLVTVSWSILSLIPISFMGDRSKWLTPRALVDVFVKAARSARIVALPCATAGIVAGALGVTGLGVRLSSVLLKMAGGNLFVLLLLVALVTLVMGCGLPAILCYLVQIPVTIPAMIEMGVPTVGAHLFVIYYSTLAFITPPVGMSIYAAMGLAKSSLMQTGWEAVKLGAAGFMVPFVFVFCPSLLLLELNAGVLYDVATAVLSVFSLAIATEGFLFEKVSWPVRILLFAVSGALFSPDRVLGAVGAAALAAVWVSERRRRSRRNMIGSGQANPA